MTVPDRPLVVAGAVFGFATEDIPIPFDFDFVTGDGANTRQRVLDLNIPPDSYEVGVRLNGWSVYGIPLDYNYGVIIDPSEHC